MSHQTLYFVKIHSHSTTLYHTLIFVFCQALNIKNALLKRFLTNLHGVVEEVITIFENKDEYIYIPDLRKNT